MNTRERRAVVALMTEMGRIPFPQEGKGAAGQVGYISDMRAAMPMVRSILYALVDRGGDVEREMAEFGAWVKRREGEQWR